MSSNVIAVDLTLAWPLRWAAGPETKIKNNVKGLGTIRRERCITFVYLLNCIIRLTFNNVFDSLQFVRVGVSMTWLTKIYDTSHES